VFRALSQSPEYTGKFFTMIAGGMRGEDFFAPANLTRLYDEVGMDLGKRFLTAS
jgi:hypothetical protein